MPSARPESWPRGSPSSPLKKGTGSEPTPANAGENGVRGVCVLYSLVSESAGRA